MNTNGFVYNDGGRARAGFKGKADDCVARAIAIASGRAYADVYKALAKGAGSERKSKGASARNGITTSRKWFKEYMQSIGFAWTPTMLIGSGCQTHLVAEELPAGRLVVFVSKHCTAMVDGVIYDEFDPRREWHSIRSDDGGELRAGEWRNENGICAIRRRCVYGYWRLTTESTEGGDMATEKLARAPYTRGPWQASLGKYACTNAGQRAILAVEGDKHIAFVTSQIMRTRATKYDAPDEERDANARVMAAAPILLETLIVAVQQCGFNVHGERYPHLRAADDKTPDWVFLAREVISLATGGA